MGYIVPHKYHAEAAAERERRLAWFKDARFGMFIHSQTTHIGRHA